MLFVTYNIHGFVGIDRRFKPERTLKILSKIQPDFLGLQEVVLHKKKKTSPQISCLTETLGMNSIFAPTFETKDFVFGNAFFSRWPIVSYKVHDLSIKGKEARNLIEVNLKKNCKTIHVLSTHLGLNRFERACQFLKIFQILDKFKQDSSQVYMLGDLNQISYSGSLKEKVLSFFRPMGRQSTFPSYAPFLSLDQIWTNFQHKKTKHRVHKSFHSRLASDHLPLLMELE